MRVSRRMGSGPIYRNRCPQLLYILSAHTVDMPPEVES